MSLADWILSPWSTSVAIGLAVTVLWLIIANNRLRQQSRSVQLDNARLTDRLEWLQSEFDVASDAAVMRQTELTQVHAEKAHLGALLQAQEAAQASAETAQAAQLKHLKTEFAELSTQILRTQSTAHSQQLGTLLNPLQAQLGDFRQRIDQLHHHSASERASLQAEVSSLKQASERMGQETLSLAQALKGDQSLKGQWGEVVLESLLEHAGLRRGIEFLIQPTCTTAAGETRRPDVIVHLPSGRDVVIDAKVSLGDYQLSTASGNRASLKRHAAKLKQHVRILAQRDYDRLEGVRSLDLVLMFVPLDAALGAALEVAPELLDEALAQRIAVVSPNSLMLVLRLIHSLWQQQAQHDNADEIARQAASLHDQFAAMLADLEGLCRQLGSAEKAASGIRARLGLGPDSVLRRVDGLRQLGAPAQQPLQRKPKSSRSA